jgi:hypothetical protein
MQYDLCRWRLVSVWFFVIFFISAALDPLLATGLVVIPLSQGRLSLQHARAMLHQKSRWHTALFAQNDGYPSGHNNDRYSHDIVNPLMALALEEWLFKVQTLMNMSDNNADSREELWWSHLMKTCQESVYVGPSSSQPGAGKGLFAQKNLDQGTLVSFYPVHGIGSSIF